jgi:hypothetical protein
LQKALSEKDEMRNELYEIDRTIKEIHPNEVSRMRALVRLEVRKDKERQELRRLEQLLEVGGGEKILEEEKRILKEEIEFLQKTVITQQASSFQAFKLSGSSNSFSPTTITTPTTPTLTSVSVLPQGISPSQSQLQHARSFSPMRPLSPNRNIKSPVTHLPPPPPQRATPTSLNLSNPFDNVAPPVTRHLPPRQSVAKDVELRILWVTYGSRKSKISINILSDVDEFRTLACRAFSLSSPTSYDLYQTPTFLDLSHAISTLSSSVVFLIHCDYRMAYGDVECVRLAEEKSRGVNGQWEGPPKLQLPPIFHLNIDKLSELRGPSTSLLPMQWPVSPFPIGLAYPKGEDFKREAPRPPLLPKWLQDEDEENITELTDTRVTYLKQCLFQLQMLLRNSEDGERIHMDQQRTLRMEIELLQKEVEVLKRETDMYLPGVGEGDEYDDM